MNQQKMKSYLFDNWTIIERGPALCQLELITILDTINRERIKDFSLLNKIACQISKSLQSSLGRGNWPVILFHGKQYARKFVSSGQFFLVLKRTDNLMVFLWLNRIKGVQYST